MVAALWRVLLAAVKWGLITPGSSRSSRQGMTLMVPPILLNDYEKLALPLAASNLWAQVHASSTTGSPRPLVALALLCLLLFLVLQRHRVRAHVGRL